RLVPDSDDRHSVALHVNSTQPSIGWRTACDTEHVQALAQIKYHAKTRGDSGPPGRNREYLDDLTGPIFDADVGDWLEGERRSVQIAIRVDGDAFRHGTDGCQIRAEVRNHTDRGLPRERLLRSQHGGR